MWRCSSRKMINVGRTTMMIPAEMTCHDAAYGPLSRNSAVEITGRFRLGQLLGYAPHELDEDVDRDDVRAHEQQDRRHPGVVGTQRVHDLEGRDLGGDAGYQRGQQEEHHDALPEPELEPVDRVRGHGADDDGPEDREQQDDPGVHEALKGPAPDEERRVVAPLGGAREVERTALLELLLRLERRHQDHRERQQRHDAPDDQRAVLDGLGDDGGHARFTFSSGMIRRWIQVTISTINSRITAMAEAWPTLWFSKAMSTVLITNVMVPLSPWVMMNGISNTAMLPEIARIKERPRIGRMPGKMMKRNCCHLLAPSIAAASYSWLGIDWMAPRKSTKFRPMYRHTDAPAREKFATDRSPSQRTPGSIPKKARAASRVPPGLKKYRNVKAIATPLMR